MARSNTFEAVSKDLFTEELDLKERYEPLLVARILRLRDAYNWIMANPGAKDKAIVDYILQKNSGLSKSSAYDDAAILKKLLPMISQSSRDFHRWRYNEWILETYKMAKARQDTKTMERCASSYAKYNAIDHEDEASVPFDLIVTQPFCATMDVRVLGIKPIPNVFQHIEKLAKELANDLPDVEDVDFEDADLEEAKVFGELPA